MRALSAQLPSSAIATPMTDLAERRDVAPGAVLHCDLKGPLDLGYNKAMFALVVVDKATRVVSTQDLRSKADVPRALYTHWRLSLPITRAILCSRKYVLVSRLLSTQTLKRCLCTAWLGSTSCYSG